MIEMPRAASLRMMPKSVCASRSVRAAVGSSRINTRQSRVSALAISTSCWCEIGKSRTSALGSTLPSSRRTSPARRSSAAVVHQPRPAGVGGGHEHVLRHRHVRAQFDLLVDESDAQFLRYGRRRDLDRPAVEQDLAAVGPHDPVDDVHQGRFAGSVLAGDGVDLASAQVETDGLQRMGRAERFADVLDRRGSSRIP